MIEPDEQELRKFIRKHKDILHTLEMVVNGFLDPEEAYKNSSPLTQDEVYQALMLSDYI